MKSRVLLLPPTARDAELSLEILREAGLDGHACTSIEELCREIESGAGVVLLTDVAVSETDPQPLVDTIHGQPAWSDLPIVLLAPLGADSPVAVWAMEALGNVTVLDHPVRIVTLVSALRTAVKARLRQYELRDRMQALHNSDKQKDEFLATLSHELRNPLAPIRNALHILRLAGADEQTRSRVIDTMERQTANVIRLVDDLLELSRINEGRIALRKERVKLQAVLRGALETSAAVVEAAGQELVVHEPDEAILLHADPVRLIQVVSNLLNNAAKYSEPGGKVVLTARAEDSVAVISVRDSGIGIPPEMLDRIFEMFVQVDTSLERTRQGLGIGLTLVKRLVELHGGEVQAKSEGRGKGSEFLVRLPAFADERLAPAVPAQNERRRTDLVRFRILVADDHHDSGESLATLLRLLGHEVRVVYDGKTALEIARTFKPQVGLLDIAMPGMDGAELARRLRQDFKPAELLLVALTGYGRDEDRQRSLSAGFNAHLVKPVDVADLNALLVQRAGPLLSVAP